MIEYRKATVDEADLLVRIRVDFLREANNINVDEEMALFENIRQFMFETLADGSFIAWVAVKDGEIIATSGISFYVLPPNKRNPSGKTAYISNMFTYPEHRNQGIAGKLFALSVGEAENAGYKKILLNATDMGRPIYEKFGFTDLHNEMIYFINHT